VRFVPNFVGVESPAAPPPASPVTTTTLAPPPPIATHAALVTAAPAEERRRPVSVSIEGLGVVAPVVATGVDPGTGQLAIPGDADTVVWYEHGASPGEDGSAVIAGHVDFNGRRGVFFDLDDVPVGSIVTVTHDDGTSTPFQVVDRRSHAKPDLPTSELFRRQGEPTLVLITCGGEFDREARSYRSNVVVTAVPVG
jgi:LPXTG-site transpeptidase (sortase) family protein